MAFGAILLAGCAAGEAVGTPCEFGSECESGACKDGVCVDASGSGGAATSSGPGTGGGEAGSGGSGAGGSGAGASGGGSGLCSPNADGTVARDEVPLGPGLDAKFKVASDVTLSSAGELIAGVRTWDFTASFPTDATELLETLPLSGTWYEAEFPGASYAARLSSDSDLLGIFEITSDALLLRGVVSPTGPTDPAPLTQLEYDPPAAFLSFPLSEGASWSTTSTVTGFASGVVAAYTETYASEVDASGSVLTPFSTFDALRVRIELTRSSGGVPILTQTSFAFVAECFGTVATLRSNPGETAAEFSDVAELQRLSP